MHVKKNMNGMKKMNKEAVYTSLWKIFVAVVLFCYIYFLGYGIGDLIISVLVTLTLIGLSELVGCVIVLIYQAYKYFMVDKNQ